MRFAARALTGLALFAAALLVVVIGGRGFIACAPGVGTVLGKDCVFDQPERARGRGAGRAGGERDAGPAVRVGVVERSDARPQTIVLGEIREGRVLELRAGAPGRLIEIGAAVEDGARVAEGALLFRVDPSEIEAQIADAAAALAEAEAESAEAARALSFAEADLEAAVEQRALREKALGRQTGLEERGFSTEAALEEARLQLAEAERAVITRDSARVAAAKRVQQSELAAERARIVLREARRSLDDATMLAPFAGVIEAPTAEEGRRVSLNEALGRLIDPTTLEVAFRVPDRVFGGLLDDDSAIRPLPVEARLFLGAREITAQGRLSRVGARSAPGEGGRLVYADLDLAADTPLRPGDLVQVTLTEAAIPDAARLPAEAVSLRRLQVSERRAAEGAPVAGGAIGEILIVGPDDRLAAKVVTIVRREGGWVWVAGAPIGARVALERGPALNPGVRVRPIGKGGDGGEGGEGAEPAAEDSPGDAPGGRRNGREAGRPEGRGPRDGAGRERG